MKLSQCLLLVAIIAFVAMTAINCVQNTTPQPSPSPAASPTFGPLPANPDKDEQLAIYNKAIDDPYVKERLLETQWRSAKQVDSRLIVKVNLTFGDVAYMRYHEISPGIDRWAVLPAARIVPGNGSGAGVDVVAFYDTGKGRVAYIGFVPRPGAPVDGITFTAFDGGVDEVDRPGGVPVQYENVTIVDTGYVKGTNLTGAQVDQAVSLAMRNATVRNYLGEHNSRMRGNITVYGKETGYPYRYVLAYPMVIIDAMSGDARYDTIYAWVDPAHERVVSVEHGEHVVLDEAGFKVLDK